MISGPQRSRTATCSRSTTDRWRGQAAIGCSSELATRDLRYWANGTITLNAAAHRCTAEGAESGGLRDIRSGEWAGDDAPGRRRCPRRRYVSRRGPLEGIPLQCRVLGRAGGTASRCRCSRHGLRRVGYRPGVCRCGALAPATPGPSVLGVSLFLEANLGRHRRRSSASPRRLTSSQGMPCDSPASTRRARFSISAAHSASTAARFSSGSSRLASNSAATSARSSAGHVNASRRSSCMREVTSHSRLDRRCSTRNTPRVRRRVLRA